MRPSASITTAALTCEGSCQATVMPGRTPASASHPEAADASTATWDTVSIWPLTSRSSGRSGRLAAHSSSSPAMVPAVTAFSRPDRPSAQALAGGELHRQLAHGVYLASIFEQFRFPGQVEVG